MSFLRLITERLGQRLTARYQPDELGAAAQLYSAVLVPQPLPLGLWRASRRGDGSKLDRFSGRNKCPGSGCARLELSYRLPRMEAAAFQFEQHHPTTAVRALGHKHVVATLGFRAQRGSGFIEIDDQAGARRSAQRDAASVLAQSSTYDTPFIDPATKRSHQTGQESLSIRLDISAQSLWSAAATSAKPEGYKPESSSRRISFTIDPLGRPMGWNNHAPT